ncbi:MAG: hypothetical protein H0V01_08300 [Bacteroidetes bacterium]|nr:hypothetical protein [Bacteroidota bacterium]HET6243708.1 hypothetical protein [Bacteroidia bacterium]
MKIIILPLFIVFVCSCKKYPQACIETSEYSIDIGQTITFTDCSKNSFSREWLIQGDKYTEESVSIYMNKAGDFSASLTVFSKNELVSDKAKIEYTVIQPSGHVTFWSKKPLSIPVSVTVSNYGVKKITNYTDTVFDCEPVTSANFILPPGIHLYTSVPNYGAVILDSIQVTRDKCLTVLLD